MRTGNIVSSSKIKELQGRIEKEKAGRAIIEMEIAERRKKIKHISGNINYLEQEIGKLGKEQGIIISEHALLRYISKVELIPIENIYNKVVTEEFKRVVSILGDNGDYPIWDGTHVAILRNSIIVTIK